MSACLKSPTENPLVHIQEALDAYFFAGCWVMWTSTSPYYTSSIKSDRPKKATIDFAYGPEDLRYGYVTDRYQLWQTHEDCSIEDMKGYNLKQAYEENAIKSTCSLATCCLKMGKKDAGMHMRFMTLEEFDAMQALLDARALSF